MLGQASATTLWCLFVSDFTLLPKNCQKHSRIATATSSDDMQTEILAPRTGDGSIDDADAVWYAAHMLVSATRLSLLWLDEGRSWCSC